MALLEPIYDAPAATRRSKAAPPKRTPQRRTLGLLGRMSAEQKAKAYAYDGDITCGPPQG